MKVLTTVLAVLTRRAITWIGVGGDAVSDNDVVEFVSWTMILGNEAWQAWKAHKHGATPGSTTQKVLDAVESMTTKKE